MNEPDTLKIIIIIAIGIGVILLVDLIFRLGPLKNNKLHRRYLARLIKVIVIFGCVANVVKAIDPKLNFSATLLKGSALIVAIVGFAAQTAISDIICGLLISFNKPFEIGDRIIIEGQEPGIVEDITLRHTVLRIYDDIRIIVPNSQLNTKTVINTSYKNAERRGIHMQFSVSYDTDVQRAIDVIRDCVAESPYTLGVDTGGLKEDSGPVYFLKFADSALILETTIWITRSTSSYVAITDINLRVNKAFRANGIEIPYNYVNVVEFEGKKLEADETAVVKAKTAPSKRRYRTNTVRITAGSTAIGGAIEAARSFARRQRLRDKDAMQLELMTEETLGIIGKIVEDVTTNFWIEGTGLKYRIHLNFTAKVGSEEYRKLINLSTSGRNEAVSGFAGKILNIMLNGIYTSGNDSSDSGYNWAMSEDTLNEDEIAESILAAVADDIKVSVTKESVDFIVVKSS